MTVYPYGRADRSRYVVVVASDGASNVFNVYATADQARAECARLRKHGFDASVREGVAEAPDWVGNARDATRPMRGPA